MPLVRAVTNTAIGALLVVMGLSCMGTAIGLFVQRQNSADFTHCTAEWQGDFLEAFKARSAANLAVTDSMDAIVKAVANQDSDAFRRAVRHYQTVRDKQVAERAKNPLPPLPAVRCGE